MAAQKGVAEMLGAEEGKDWLIVGLGGLYMDAGNGLFVLHPSTCNP